MILHPHGQELVLHRIKYSVEFDSTGGRFVEPVKVSDGYVFKDIENPVRQGFVFDGWDKDITKGITSDIKFTAKWLVDESFDQSLQGNSIKEVKEYKPGK